MIISSSLKRIMGYRLDIRFAFGCVLRRVRKEQNISQERLALEAEIDRAHISKLENGVFQPNIATIFAIAQVLECRPGELIDMVEDDLLTKKWAIVCIHCFESKIMFKIWKSFSFVKSFNYRFHASFIFKHINDGTIFLRAIFFINSSYR